MKYDNVSEHYHWSYLLQELLSYNSIPFYPKKKKTVFLMMMIAKMNMIMLIFYNRIQAESIRKRKSKLQFYPCDMGNGAWTAWFLFNPHGTEN